MGESNTRARIQRAATVLFRRPGYSATGLKRIAVEADAPFGSIYHFFPGGKQQVAEDMIRVSGTEYGRMVLALLDSVPDPVESLVRAFEAAADDLAAADYADACPIGTVALEVASSNEVLRTATAEVFEEWVGTATQWLNNTDTQTEYWVGRDSNVVSRDLSKPRQYTPSLVNVNVDLPNANKIGRWRWIAPGMVYFSVYLNNDWEDTGPTRTGTNTIGVTLPTPAIGTTGQVVKGVLHNPNCNGGLPNVVEIHAEIAQSSSSQTVATLLFPNSTDIAQSLDGLRAVQLLIRNGRCSGSLIPA
ncbi:TetR/AcrR family transcriptional regulator [Streptomyces sp. NPDC005423]|uniref:TetR/AcrR family transcriptional regulator n=1 Tax=Streptomyces sp. NPDC005423 TaxID=3155343 RepID=UPI0033BB79A8